MDVPANNIFSGPITSTVNAVPFDKSRFTRQCKKEDRKALRFQILLFDWSFSSDILAVKRLTVKDSSIRSNWTYLTTSS